MSRTSETEELASERLHSAQARAKLGRVGLSSASIQRFLGEVMEDDLHVKTILSLPSYRFPTRRLVYCTQRACAST